MDNLDKIKFKEAGNNWYIKIFLDKNGNEESRTPSFADGKGSGTGLYKEMQVWVKAGNTIEPQFTSEELAAKEAGEIEAAKTTYKGLRKSAYEAAGLTFDVWSELVIEKNTAGQTAFRAARDAIKAEIPKPV